MGQVRATPDAETSSEAGRVPGRPPHRVGASRPQPGGTRGRAALPPRPPPGPHPGQAPRVSQRRRRRRLLTCRARPAVRTWEGRGRIRAAGASGKGAPGSAAAASPGLRGTGGRSRHPHGRPQEVGPPTHRQQHCPAAPAPCAAPPPARPRPSRERASAPAVPQPP